MPSLKLWAVAAVVVPVAMFAGSARADDGAAPTQREKQLEKRVEDLEKMLADVNRKLSDGSSSAGDELNERVGEMEKLQRADKDGLFPYWSNGIRMDSANGAFKLKIGGRTQNDWSWFWGTESVRDGLPDEEIEAGEEFRRARLYIGGTIYSNIDFMAEYDFANGAVKARELWIGTTFCNNVRFQVGSMKEPFGLEELTSDLFTTFVERSSADQAFAPSYNTGFLLSGVAADDNMTWAAGVFRNANNAGDDFGNTRSGEYNVTARLTGRPWVGGEDEFLHLGAAGSYRTPDSNFAAFGAQPEMHLAPFLTGTGALHVNRVHLYEGEAAFVQGPFSAQAEYFYATTHRGEDGPTPNFYGWNAQASWFLTGESRPYDKTKGVFGRIKPKSNFDGGGEGWGAWEVAARWDTLNLNDDGVDGGHMNILTLGMNWYLNPNTKVQLDWVHAHVLDAGHMNGLEMRFQIDF
jgi:phosphate-selective porin OprO/OprP